MSISSTASNAPRRLAKVSICLPTCNRPELIAQCIDSCLAQTHGNLEIVIGDDSKDTRTQQLIAARYGREPRVRYTLNQPPLGQACNVASLFERASGDKIVLIHDDDLLTTDGVEKLLVAVDASSATRCGLRRSVRGRPQRRRRLRREHAAELGVPPDEGRRRPAAAGRQNRSDPDVPEQRLDGRRAARQADRLQGPVRHVLRFRVRHRTLSRGARGVLSARLCLRVSQDSDLDLAQHARHGGGGDAQRVCVREGAAAAAELEPSRRLALRRLVPIVVSVQAKNRQALTGFRIALAHLFAYNYGFSARLYYHLLMLARAGLSVRQQTVAAAAVAVVAAAPAVAADPAAVVKELVTELVTDGREQA